jgi:enoyl-CoA hydratase/carnithine racemase
MDLEQQCAAVGIHLVRGDVRWDVVLATPERRNAQLPSTWRALKAVGDAVRHAGPRVVVLSAQGPSFSAGLDRAMFTGAVGADERGLPQLAAMDDDAIDAEIAWYQGAFTWWREVDALTVAAVQGHAVGAGFQLALACDLRVVADDVAFAMKETSLGLVPDLAGTWPLVEAVGYARALEVCVSGRVVAAAEAVSTGLAVTTVPPDRLAGAVDDLVAALLAAPAAAVTATKHLLAGAPSRSPQEQRAAERLAQRDRLRDLARAAGVAGS